MAVSRVINLQHHRIAQVRQGLCRAHCLSCPWIFHKEVTCLPLPPPQCRMVKITIRGDEGVPVQVDGEAWIQPPGVIKIQHKNRAQMLTRDRVSNPLQVGRWSHGNLAAAKILRCLTKSESQSCSL